MIMNNAVFWDMTPRGCCKNRRSSVTYRIICRVLQLLIIAKVLSSPSLATLMIQAKRSSETLVLTKATCPNIQQDGILHSHRRERLKSYEKTIFKILFLFCYE
jgi:hypothetical protein